MSNSPSTESFEDRWCCAACYQKNFTLPHARATAEQTANKRVADTVDALYTVHDEECPRPDGCLTHQLFQRYEMLQSTPPKADGKEGM